MIPKGWQCPVCMTVWAPYITSCSCSQGKVNPNVPWPKTPTSGDPIPPNPITISKAEQ